MNKDTVKRVLLSMLIMSMVVILVDLYVPVKRLISGDTLSFNDILTSINLRHHLPYIFISGIIVGFLWDKSKKEEKSDK